MTTTPARRAGTAGADAASAADRLGLGEEDPRAYIQIAGRIQQQIQDGTLPARGPAPSITTLVQQTGHARQTCAKAYRLLVDKGLLTRWPGLGYYVTAQDGGPCPEAAPGAGAAAAQPRPVSREIDPASRVPQASPLTPEPGRGAAVMPLFRPPAGIPARPAPQAAPLPVPAAGPDDDRGQADDTGMPLENLLGHHAWPAGEDHLRWLIVPDGPPAAEAAGRLAGRYRDLAGWPGLAAVPPQWLHIAAGHVGPAAQVNAAALARMVSVVRERCARLSPFPVTLTPAQVTPGGVACKARPATALRGLEAITADAAKAAGCTFPAPPAALRTPHMMLAHATAGGTTGPLENRLARHQAAPAAEPRIFVSAVHLVRARHDGRHITWRMVETITIGRRSP